MLPPEDSPKIPGVCNNERRPSFSQMRLPSQGTRCDGWKTSQNATEDDGYDVSRARIVTWITEIERLQKLVVYGGEHDDDCDHLNLAGDLECNCAGGRARIAVRAATSNNETEQRPETKASHEG